MIAWWRDQFFPFPWRVPAPEWQKLVGEVLLQRTRAGNVAAMYDEFFARFPTPDALARATAHEARDAIYSLGLLWRAGNLPPLGATLAAGGVPTDRRELEALPGVGPYVAGAFLTLHRNERAPFVDANVVRLLGRYLGFEWDAETRRKRWLIALVERLFDNDYVPRDFGYALLDFTREVCGKPPRCELCPVRADCKTGQRGLRGRE